MTLAYVEHFDDCGYDGVYGGVGTCSMLICIRFRWEGMRGR